MKNEKEKKRKKVQGRELKELGIEEIFIKIKRIKRMRSRPRMNNIGHVKKFKKKSI